MGEKSNLYGFLTGGIAVVVSIVGALFAVASLIGDQARVAAILIATIILVAFFVFALYIRQRNQIKQVQQLIAEKEYLLKEIEHETNLNIQNYDREG